MIRLLSEFPDKNWKLGSIDSLLKRIRKTGTIVRQRGSGRPRSADRVRRIAMTTLRRWRTSCWVGSTSQYALLSMWDFPWKWHSTFKCGLQDNPPWTPAQMLQQRCAWLS